MGRGGTDQAMIHRILTCKNHPELRWSTKDIAWDEGGYNGSRNIFFKGTPSGRKRYNDDDMYEDYSGLDCTTVRNEWADPASWEVIRECTCSPTDLVLAPEDKLVRRRRE